MATKGKKHTTRYPWEKWFSSGKFKIVRGVDYHYRSSIMAQMIRNIAYRKTYGEVVLSIDTADDDSYLIVHVKSYTPKIKVKNDKNRKGKR